MSIKLTTYSLQPFFTNTNNPSLPTEFLRIAISKQLHRYRQVLETSGADISLFHNHESETGKNRINYPLIIYHYKNNMFYITGINNGADTLALLAGICTIPFEVDGVVFTGFKKIHGKENTNLEISIQTFKYALVQWLPVNHDSREAYKLLGIEDKVKVLKEKLWKHLFGDLAKYLNVNLEGLKVEINDITAVYKHPVEYRTHLYSGLDITFSANVLLPAMLTLGNIKSLGFGRVEPL